MTNGLSVCVVSANAGTRLEWWLEWVGAYASEVLVAIDSASTNGTAAIARREARVVGTYDADADATLVRGWLWDQADGDWILEFRDDEVLSAAAVDQLPALLEDRRFTHYRFGVRTVVGMANGEPGSVLHPDVGPAAQLFRNVVGLRTAPPAPPGVLGHQRELVDDPACAVYRFDARYLSSLSLPAPAGDPSDLPLALPEIDRARCTVVRRSPDRPTARPATPVSAAELEANPWTGARDGTPWSATYRLLGAPGALPANCGHVVPIEIANTSDVRWTVTGSSTGRVAVGTRWRSAGWGDEMPIGDTTFLPYPVGPGESVEVEVGIWTPRLPGQYELVVDLLQEGHSWFSQHGVGPLAVPVTVHPGAAPHAVRHFVGRLADDPDRSPDEPVASTVITRPPVRIADSRDGSGLVDAPHGPLRADELLVMRLAGRGGIPPEATGVLVHVSVLAADYDGWLAVFPTDGTAGEAFPALHFAADGRPVTAPLTVGLGRGRGHGRLSFHAGPGPADGSLHLVVDVHGYLLASAFSTP